MLGSQQLTVGAVSCPAVEGTASTPAAKGGGDCSGSGAGGRTGTADGWAVL